MKENEFSESSMAFKLIQDLTADISEELVVFPGDPSFKSRPLKAIGNNASFNLHELRLCNHAGTHIDFPSHVISGGKTSSDYSLADLVLDGMIVEVPHELNSISEGFISTLALNAKCCVFFKTRNSKISKHGPFVEDYVFIEPAAARALLKKKISVVGIDYISVDDIRADQLPVHNILLSQEVLIVENLELRDVTPGRCKIFIMPTKIANMDGLPARVMLAR